MEPIISNYFSKKKIICNDNDTRSNLGGKMHSQI